MEGRKNGRGRPKRRNKAEVGDGLGPNKVDANFQNGGLKLKMRIRSDNNGHQIVEVIKPDDDNEKPSTSQHKEGISSHHSSKKEEEKDPVESDYSTRTSKGTIVKRRNEKGAVETYDTGQTGNAKRRGRPKGVKNSASPPKVSVYQGTSTRPSAAILRQDKDTMDGDSKVVQNSEEIISSEQKRGGRKSKPKPLNLKFITNLGGGIKLKKGRGRPRKHPRPEDMLNEDDLKASKTNGNTIVADTSNVRPELPKGAKKRKATKPQPFIESDGQDDAVESANGVVDQQYIYGSF
ncbi:unnamed protein product [Bursaphelenchus xylophilus]|uniref:(pine wood nematode) hypothetical protein n=1 Tax=Bursaphelenchus xylophilus TaxID=6326 RepID=A0A1I7S027_BURXY|nr:unnamed protein product [Bursaphelenchus xylophilus]CAG9109062.1 unnamed protein product [Bursaphelenchus xylophilus]